MRVPPLNSILQLLTQAPVASPSIFLSMPSLDQRQQQEASHQDLNQPVSTGLNGPQQKPSHQHLNVAGLIHTALKDRQGLGGVQLAHQGQGGELQQQETRDERGRMR